MERSGWFFDACVPASFIIYEEVANLFWEFRCFHIPNGNWVKGKCGTFLYFDQLFFSQEGNEDVSCLFFSS